MARLVREVRINLADTPPGDSLAENARRLPADLVSSNGYAGVPAMDPLARYFALQVGLIGTPDPATGYLCNIKLIDQAVRAKGVPALRASLASGFSHASALRGLHVALLDAWPGARLERLRLQLSPFTAIEHLAEEPTMIRLSQRFEFSAAHRLHVPTLSESANREAFGKCNNPHGHGHNYEVQVTIAGTPNATGRLMPTAAFEHVVAEAVIDRFDHKHLNIEVPEFAELNPSVENIAAVIFRLLAVPLRTATVRLASVTVWETPKTWCEVTENDAAQSGSSPVLGGGSEGAADRR